MKLQMFVLLNVCSWLLIKPASGNTTRKFQNALSQQNMQTVLTSIEDRLRNLDSVYTSQFAPGVLTKVEQNGRKIESLESQLGRFETVVEMQFDKIAENMSNGHFKNEIAKDHIVRKIESVYDRIQHRLLHLEMKVDIGEKKILDKLDLLLTRFEKMEETLTTREADIEEGIGDVLVAVDDIKFSQSNYNNHNITKLFNESFENAQRDIKYDIGNINKNIATMINRLQSNSNKMINDTLHEISSKEEKMKSIMQEHNNRLLGVNDVILKRSDLISNNLQRMATILNTTRNEQQNGFRSLIVQVGRLGGKSNVLADGVESGALKTLGDKIDANFENIMVLQNLFLESCHRIQMDETQLEAKISEVLEKIIDTFEQKSSIDLKDRQNLELLIKNHDSTIMRNLYSTSRNMGVLLNKGKENKEELKFKLTQIESKIQTLYSEIDEMKRNGFGKDRYVLMEKLKELQIELQVLAEKFKDTNDMVSTIISSVSHAHNTLIGISSNNTKHTQNADNYMRELRQNIDNISKKLKTIHNFIQDNDNDKLSSRFEELLGKHLTGLRVMSNITSVSTPKPPTTTTTEKVITTTTTIATDYNIDPNIDEIIRNVFGLDQIFTPIDEESQECVDYDIDVRNSGSVAKRCNKTNNTPEVVFESNEVTNCAGIDVRGNIPNRVCTNLTTETDVYFKQPNLGEGLPDNKTHEINFTTNGEKSDEADIVFFYPGTDTIVDVRGNFQDSAENSFKQSLEGIEINVEHNSTRENSDTKLNLTSIEGSGKT